MHFFNLIKSISIRRSNVQYGFSLIEVFVVIAISSLLVAIAMPSFTSTVRRYRADGIRDDFIASLQIAKSEAIRTGLPVKITRTPFSANCTAVTSTVGVWTCGWQIFDSTGLIIQQSTVPNGFSVIDTSTAPSDSIIADRFGLFSNTTPRMIIAPIISGVATASDPSANAVCLGVGGKLTKVKQTTGDVTC